MQLVWDELGKRTFETGIDRGVLYVDGLDGVAWNGLTNVTESPSGGAARPFYIDGVKYLNIAEGEEFAGSISAYYSPEEFDLCDGTLALGQGVFAHHQVRRPFCFSFRTRVGNDIVGTDHGYKIHIVYNAMAMPATRSYRSLADSSEANSLTWSITTRSIPFPELAPTAHITVDTTKAAPSHVAELEAILYGSELEDARVPFPEEILSIFSGPAFIVVDNGDGTFSISGGDTVVIDHGDGTFTLDDSSVTTDGNEFTATSL